MFKKVLMVLLGMTVMVSAAGCGGSKEEESSAAEAETQEETAGDQEAATSAEESSEEASQEETTGEQEAAEESSEEASQEEALDPITPSDYLMKDAAEYVKLDALKGLKVPVYSYEVTDEMVQEQIQMDLLNSGEEKEVDAPAEEGNIVHFTMDASIQDSEGEVYTLDDMAVTLGEGLYGEEFEEAFVGASKGDELSFTVTFDEDESWEEWMKGTVDCQASVVSVCELEVPEYNDEFVSEYTEYSSMEAYEKAIRNLLYEEYEAAAEAESTEETLLAAVEAVEFSEAPQELYDAAREEVMSFYQDASGLEKEEEILDYFGITAEDLEEEIQQMLRRRLLVSAICQENKLEVTEEDYVSYVTEESEGYGYDSVKSFEADMGRSSLVWELYEARAMEYLDGVVEREEVSYEEPEEDELEEEIPADGEEAGDETEAEAEEGAGAVTDTDAGTEAGEETGEEAGEGAEEETGEGAGAEAGEETGAETGEAAVTDAEAGDDAGAGSGDGENADAGETEPEA